MLDLNSVITQKQFADLIGVSEPAVSGMVRAGIIAPGETAGRWLHSYCGHIREQAAGRATLGDLDLATERARLAKEQADRVAMLNAERRGELAPVADMEMVLATTGAKVGKILDAICGLIRRRVPGIGSDVVEAVAADIAKCRNMAASMTLASLSEDDEAQPDDDIAAEVNQ